MLDHSRQDHAQGTQRPTQSPTQIATSSLKVRLYISNVGESGSWESVGKRGYIYPGGRSGVRYQQVSRGAALGRETREKAPVRLFSPLQLVLLCHRWHLSVLQHQAADCLVPLDPGVVVCLRPVLSEKVGESLQQGRSDEGIMLWPDSMADVQLAKFPKHIAQYFRMLHVLDDQGQCSLQFLTLLRHIGGVKEGSRFGKAGEEPLIEGCYKCFPVQDNRLKT